MPRAGGTTPSLHRRWCPGWTPLRLAQALARRSLGAQQSGLSGRTPPGSQNVCHSTLDHLLSLVESLKQTRGTVSRGKSWDVLASAFEATGPVSGGSDFRARLRWDSAPSLARVVGGGCSVWLDGRGSARRSARYACARKRKIVATRGKALTTATPADLACSNSAVDGDEARHYRGNQSSGQRSRVPRSTYLVMY